MRCISIDCDELDKEKMASSPTGIVHTRKGEIKRKRSFFSALQAVAKQVSSHRLCHNKSVESSVQIDSDLEQAMEQKLSLKEDNLASPFATPVRTKNSNTLGPPCSLSALKSQQRTCPSDDDLTDEDDCDFDSRIAMPSIYSVKNSPCSLKKTEKDETGGEIAVSILLLHCTKKLFEIVDVDQITQDTSVRDALYKARCQALDARLSNQTYIGLCNGIDDLGTRLPIKGLINTESQAITPNRPIPSPSKKCKVEAIVAQESLTDPIMCRLLLAIPKGSSAEQVRQIQRVLWNHPALQLWWRKERCKALVSS